MAAELFFDRSHLSEQEMLDFEVVTGREPYSMREGAFVPRARDLIAMAWIATRRTNPAWSWEDQLAMRVAEFEA